MQEGAARDGGFILVEWGAYFEGGGAHWGEAAHYIIWGKERISKIGPHRGDGGCTPGFCIGR